MITHGQSRKTISGSRRKAYRHKKLYERGNAPTLPLLGAKKVKYIRARGNILKIRTRQADSVNLYNPSTKTFSIAKIKTISDNPANRNYIRRNIMTRGTVIDTEHGKARITNRPGQEGAINAILIA